MSDITTDTEVSDVGETLVDEGPSEVVSDSHDWQSPSDPGDTPHVSEGVDAPEGSTQESEAEPAVEALFEVDGQQITLDEARNSYLRQADYTRKTQELAAQREALQRYEAIGTALETNPQGALLALAEAAGIPLSLGEVADPLADLDPVERSVHSVEARLQQIEDAARQQAIQTEFVQLHERYGEFDDQALIQHAMRGNFGSLSQAYRDLNFDTVAEQASAANAAKAAEAQRVEAKRAAASAVHTDGARGGAAAPPKPQEYGSIREAYMAAKKTLGM